MVNEPLSALGPAQRDLLKSELPPPTVLALAYAPRKVRDAWLGWLALDRRFARIVGEASEPMLAQVRLAWWREILDKPVDSWPSGEPVLTALATVSPSGLSVAADGWETLLEEKLDSAALVAAAQGRADGLLALASAMGCRDDGVEGTAFRWAVADFGAHLAQEKERTIALSLLQATAPSARRMPRRMRPLAILVSLAVTAFREGRGIGGAGDFARAVRAGLVGR